MFLSRKNTKDSPTEIIENPVCANMQLIQKLKISLERKRKEATTLDQLLETMLRFIPMYAWIRDSETNEITYKNHGNKCDVFYMEEMKEVDDATSDYVRKIKDGACFLYEGENQILTLPLLVKIPLVIGGNVMSEVSFGLDLNTVTGINMYDKISKLENKPIKIGPKCDILVIDTEILVLN